MKPNGNPNKLINAKSPYLLQHAYNPVDWYEWGEEAFARAKDENKPIFLSIGYSTCHWCHNMARESFEAEDVAALLNKHYISIKVDREERPDIDHIYMKVCQAMTGQGGWPLTIIMTPDKIPFFAGTYFPREKKYHLPGLKDILGGIARVWQEKRGMLEEKGRDLLNALQQVEQDGGAGDDAVVDALVDKAVEDLRQNYDHNHGGFGSAPKFPVPHALTFLLRAWKRSGDAQLLEMVVHTLKRMRQGGIFDQLGYGFHRYSVDDKWIVPHFEKMLYDQALIALAYVEAYQAAGEAVFAETAHSVLTYTLGEMQDPGGAFYAAENAESEGVEGKYYTWRRAEIMDILGKEDGSLLCDYFGTTEQGNMEGGQNVLHLPHAESYFLSKQGIGEKEWSFLLESSRKKLLEARAQRIRPSRDEKILTSWNGLMISALAKGGGALRGDIYTDQARRAADFFLAKLLINGELYHQCIDGEVDIPAFLEDYAFFCAGLLDLFEVVQDPYYLEQAYQLNQKMLNLFWDKDQGGLFFAPAGSSELPLTGKDPYDGATPSGNSVAALNMLRLAAVTADDKLEQQARDLINSFARLLSASPSSFTAMLSAYDFARGPVQQIVIADAQAEETGMRMLSKVHELFLPRRVLLYAKEKTKERLHKLCPYLDDKTAKEGKGTAYVCQNYSCQAPVNSTEELVKQLKI